MHVVVVGGGVLGCAAAYYVSTDPSTQVTVLEQDHSLACGASGKAGGFLALDWNDGTPLQELSRRSFRLHQQLASDLGASSVDFRAVDTFSLALSSGARKRLGNAATTAQVHPEKLCRRLADIAESRGTRFLFNSRVTRISLDEDKIRVVIGGEEGSVLEADVIVLAMGPWSSVVSQWIPIELDVVGEGYHSICLEADVAPEVLFLDQVEDGSHPEVYPRPGGEVYVCGGIARSDLPAQPSLAVPDDSSCDKLLNVAGRASERLKAVKVLKKQLCFLPVNRKSGLPVIESLESFPNVFVATGHSCWGILNAPATGEALAQLILSGKSDLDLEAFKPRCGTSTFG